MQTREAQSGLLVGMSDAQVLGMQVQTRRGGNNGFVAIEIITQYGVAQRLHV